MADADKAELRAAMAKKNEKIQEQWAGFSRTDAYEDLMQYIDGLKDMYMKYCEEQAMPHPAKPDDVVPLGNDMIASLLQARRGCGMVQTYIRNRVDTDVAQPTKPSK